MGSLKTLGLLALVALLWAGPAWAHGKEQHAKPGEAAAAVTPDPAQAALPPEPFPLDIGGPFSLVEHTGRKVTDRDYRGSYLLIFFGYAQCEGLCPVGLKNMVDALDLLGDAGAEIQPLLITVDPEHDTVETMAAHVGEIHPRLIGLTGTAEDIAAVRKAYKVEAKAQGTSWKGKAIFSHGTLIYLMRPDGGFATLMPPVLDAETMARTIERYL